MTQIKDALLESNPWWKQSFALNYEDREIYIEIQKYMPLPQIISITGLRRTGKTMLLYKVVLDTINNGFEPKNIIYFTFDEFKSVELREILKEYEVIFGKDVKREKYLLLLDEIQKLEDWSEQLKRIYDLYNKNVKILISGSESLYIKKESREVLAGRIYEFKVEPLSFREFLRFKKVKFEPINLYETELKALFSEFITTQGFPELVNIKDKEIIKKYIKESIVEKVIYRDLTNLSNIKDIPVLESLLNIFMEEPGQIITMQKIATELSVSRQTISLYLSYLEKSFLLKKLYNFSKNRRKVERKLKKYYPAFISPNLLFQEDNFSKSKVFEWWMVIQLRAEFFWRDSRQNEVDVVLIEDKIKPIDVKYGKVKLSGISAFLNYFDLNMGYVATSTTEESKIINNKTIKFIPGFKFLLEN